MDETFLPAFSDQQGSQSAEVDRPSAGDWAGSECGTCHKPGLVTPDTWEMLEPGDREARTGRSENSSDNGYKIVSQSDFPSRVGERGVRCSQSRF